MIIEQTLSVYFDSTNGRRNPCREISTSISAIARVKTLAFLIISTKIIGRFSNLSKARKDSGKASFSLDTRSNLISNVWQNHETNHAFLPKFFWHSSRAFQNIQQCSLRLFFCFFFFLFFLVLYIVKRDPTTTSCHDKDGSLISLFKTVFSLYYALPDLPSTKQKQKKFFRVVWRKCIVIIVYYGCFRLRE